MANKPNRFHGLMQTIRQESSPLPDAQVEQLPTANNTLSGVVSVPPNKIYPDPDQPRRYFDEMELNKMAASMREIGVIDPLTVRPKPNSDGEYDLLAGEKRWRSAIMAGLEMVPVCIFDVDDNTALDIKAISNLQRSDLNAWEETQAIMGMLMRNLESSQEEVVSLLNLAANQKRGITDNVVRNSDWQVVEDVFNLVGRLTPESFRKHRVPLLKLPRSIEQVLRQGKLQYTKVNEILKLKSLSQQEALLNEAIEANLSVEEIRQRVREMRPAKGGKEQSPNLSERLTSVTRAIKQAKVWHDPKKQKRLEKLLGELENLLQ
ncbi:ParB/RepB/Spo0J family partition protein [Planktothrix sp. FACHB-1355]|uniref:ParB/RepB/Spo0J family partition protein n=1 Tax=Aerosakkonema funiforme FACHB-1375 TaxID=2949571 RepID=A0A926ZJE2_9CYAN|nr:ParB/RepB/Spo0J family partition protein [Aerosakkonema funiforme]MBD2184569.1 ParB/RepB/Spo0J family partition protein [Aerosakkonema funiforme FACHB-1375]MBD3558938.1 ParB/RepB/Spo0J family partition protein [Planktothrix sp. FACHB-1355]